MTGKDRAQFRAQANSIEPVFQMGKGGISDGVIKQIEDAIEVRELIKVKVLLETTPESPKDIAPKLAEAVNAEVIQVIGGCIVLYRFNPKLHEKKKSKVKPKKKSDEAKRKALNNRMPVLTKKQQRPRPAKKTDAKR